MIEETIDLGDFKIPSVKSSKRDDTFILVMIDAIMDTRIGAIAERDSALAGRILSSGKYFNREFDEFESVPNADFRKLYDMRDKDTLKNSIVTNVTFLLQRIVKDVMLADAQSPNNDKLVIHLNVHPYKDFTQQELDMLRDCLRYYTYSYAEIVVIDKPIEELTPEHCKENYDIMVMYDYERFLDIHKDALLKTQIPSVTLIGPAMYRTAYPDEETLAEIKKLKMDKYQAIQIAHAPVIPLRLMPVSLFCISEIINPENKESVLKSVAMTVDFLESVKNDEQSGEVLDMDKAPDFQQLIVKSCEDEML